jgi:hypothetical protein
MHLFSVSIGEIEDDLVNYFVETQPGTRPSELTPATDLKKKFRLSGAAWQQLGDDLSDQPWMVQLGVRLSPNDMMVVSTLGQLANRILTKMQHVVAAPTSAQITPVKSLMDMSAQVTRTAAEKASTKTGRSRRN